LDLSYSEVLGWVANPIEPFSLECVQGQLPPLLPEGKRDKTREPQGMFAKTNCSLANVF
jgi:hypothetical protein